jgi:uncharacterized protein with WD repeat
VKDSVPGLSSRKKEEEPILHGKSKAALKNERRKQKQKENSELAARNGIEKPHEPGPASETQEELSVEKRMRAITKKIRQIESLIERKTAGEQLLPEQEEKIHSMAQLQAELANLKTE